MKRHFILSLGMFWLPGIGMLLALLCCPFIAHVTICGHLHGIMYRAQLNPGHLW